MGWERATCSWWCGGTLAAINWQCKHALAPSRPSVHDVHDVQVESINAKYSRAASNYVPVHYLERHVPLHERMAFYKCVVLLSRSCS